MGNSPFLKCDGPATSGAKAVGHRTIARSKNYEQARVRQSAAPKLATSHHSSVKDLLEASNVQKAGNMGRPIGSVNRQKPFADALRVEIRAGNDARHLRAIARKTDRHQAGLAWACFNHPHAEPGAL